MRPCIQLLPGLLLGLALACGGSTSPVTPVKATPVPPATGFTYTAPAGAGWRLVEDATSTATRVVLDLVGPSGTLTRGVGFNLKAPAGVKFGVFTESCFPIKDTGIYELLNAGAPTFSYPLEARLFAGGVKPGNILTVGIFQKDRRFSAKDSGTPLLQIALEFDAAAGLKAGDSLALNVPKARILPADIGGPGIPAWTSQAEYDDAQGKAHSVAIDVAVGSLVAH